MATVTEVVVVEMEHAEAAEAGLPQLDFSTFPNQIFWLLLALAATYFILKRVALPRIGGVLAERQGTITNDIAAAEDLRNKATEAEAAYDKALGDARNEAGRISQETRAEIQTDLDNAIADADAEIAARTAESEKQIAEIREVAAANVRQVARDAAQEIVAMLGARAEPEAIEEAVRARMER